MKEVSASEMKGYIEGGNPGIILDVRTPGEYARGGIPGSINVPVDEIREKIESVIPDKLACVYIYCLSGSRSCAAGAVMEKLGYKNLFNLTHGLLEWRAAGFNR